MSIESLRPLDRIFYETLKEAKYIYDSLIEGEEPDLADLTHFNCRGADSNGVQFASNTKNIFFLTFEELFTRHKAVRFKFLYQVVQRRVSPNRPFELTLSSSIEMLKAKYQASQRPRYGPPLEIPEYMLSQFESFKSAAELLLQEDLWVIMYKSANCD